MAGQSAVGLPSSVKVGWTSPRQLDPLGRSTGDPLGFRAAAARWAGRLVPVVTRSCCRVRQLSVFTLALQVSGGTSVPGGEARERFLRLERLWVIAYTRDRGRASADPTVFSGVEAATARLAGARVDIATPLLATQLTSGLWGQCRRPATQLGLVRGRGAGPEGWRLTQRGEELAAAAREALTPAASVGHAVRSREVTHERLGDVFPVATDVADSDEAWCIGEALSWHDQLPGQDGEFACLSETLEAFGGLTTTMPTEYLTSEQVRAKRVLHAISGLAAAVEAPFREHLRGRAGGLDENVGRRRAWAVLDDEGEPELAALGRRLAVNPSMRVVQAHHERLAAARGTQPWTRHAVESQLVTVRKFEPIETRLEAVQMLLEDGVVPERP